MNTTSYSAKPDATFRAENRSSCPMCQGQLLILRGFSRCARCQFVLCESCDSCEVPLNNDDGNTPADL